MKKRITIPILFLIGIIFMMTKPFSISDFTADEVNLPPIVPIVEANNYASKKSNVLVKVQGTVTQSYWITSISRGSYLLSDENGGSLWVLMKGENGTPEIGASIEATVELKFMFRFNESASCFALEYNRTNWNEEKPLFNSDSFI